MRCTLRAVAASVLAGAGLVPCTPAQDQEVLRFFEAIGAEGVVLTELPSAGDATEDAGDGGVANVLLPLFQSADLKRDPASILRARSELVLLEERLEREAAERAAAPQEPEPEADAETDAAAEAGPDAAEESAESEWPTAQDRVERLRLAAVAGHWEHVRELLETDAGEEADALYDHLVTQLQQQDTVCLPEEVLRIADCAPEAPAGDQLVNLSKLLQSASTRGSGEALGLVLDAGTRWFGGADPDARGRACELLVRAGLLGPAASFLPDLPEADVDGAPRDPELLRQHALYALYRAGEADGFGEGRALVREAWSWLEEAARYPELTEDQRSLLYAAQSQVADEIGDEQAAAWRRTLFERLDGRQGASALAGLAQELAQFQQQRRGAPDRLGAWQRIHELGEALLSAQDVPLDRWRAPLAAVTALYLTEVSQAEQLDTNRRGRSNPYYWGPSGQAITADDLLEAMPSIDWIRAVDPSLRSKLLDACVYLLASRDRAPEARSLVLEARELGPDRTRELAARYLTAWSVALDPSGRSQSGLESFNPFGSRVIMSGGITYFIGNQGPDFGQGLPVTRARQEHSLERLGEALSFFRAEGVEDVDPTAVVETFAACHSPAEVYALEDIEAVFGPLAGLPGGVAAALASAMRQRLAKQWRDPKTQDEAGARRSSEEIEAEVDSGYALALRLAERALAAEPESWNFAIAKASLGFEHAEFAYQRDPELETYAPLREAAFAGFARAATLYGQALGSGKSAPSAAPYLAWFHASLGASESGYLTRETQPDVDQVERVRRAIEVLGEQQAAEHAGLFAELIEDELSGVPSVAKERYTRHAVRVVADMPAGESVRKLSRFYTELAREVELHAELDGSTEVVAGEPFGLRLWLRSSVALAREGGGFSRYLQNQVYTPATNTPVDYRDRFEEGLRSTLFEGFEVDAIQFLPPETPSRSYGRPRWEHKALCYLVLRAKDPSIDRIPELGIDLDFTDGQGFVAVSVRSAELLIDATGSESPRPVVEPQLELTLDDRGIGEGELEVEVRATGLGVIPALDGLVDGVTGSGLELVETIDHGLNLVEVDPERHPPIPLAERSFTLRYEVVAGGDGAYTFPVARDPQTETTWRRFSDWDIVELESGETVELATWRAGTLDPGPWLALGALLVGAFAVFSLVGRGGASGAASERLSPPSDPDPVRAVAYLERLVEERPTRFDQETLEALRADVARIEATFFAPASNGASDGAEIEDLSALVRTWEERTRPI